MSIIHVVYDQLLTCDRVSDHLVQRKIHTQDFFRSVRKVIVGALIIG